MRIQLFKDLDYWINNSLDESEGGFVGTIDHHNQVIPKAPKGIILNTRILWSFSAASNHLATKYFESVSKRAFNYLKNHFFDEKYGGFYWELDYKGVPVNKRKQVYAQAFAIYSLSEYYLLSNDEKAKEMAITLFHLLEEKAYDSVNGGYIEAFDEDWGELSDLRLSVKDMNAAKTMNTHLHVLEAYTLLLRIYDSEDLKSSLKSLILLLQDKFLNDNFHYNLFFDTKWNLLSHSVSYGHDIEAVWLLIDAAVALNEPSLLAKVNESAIRVAETFRHEAIDEDKAILNEKNLLSNEVDNDKHWWPQVEALIGFDYVYRLTKDNSYLEKSVAIWNYIKNNLLDHVHGEWYFRVNDKGEVYKEEDKVSMWKAPYHTTRACIKLNENMPCLQ